MEGIRGLDQEIAGWRKEKKGVSYYMEHYLVLADRGHLKILAEVREPGQRTPTLTPVEEMEFPGSFRRTVDEVSDSAGRFPSSKGMAGMSIDERLPMLEEREHRMVRQIATEVSHFIGSRPGASWIFAAAIPLHRAVLEQIDEGAKQRLRGVMGKDLIKWPLTQLRSHFCT